MAEELKPEALEPWKDRVLFHLSEIDGLAADSRGCYENARGNDSACYGQTEEIRKLLASVSELVAAAKRLDIGWRGTGPNKDIFYCEYCRAHHEDWSAIDHEPDCFARLFIASLAKFSEKKG